MNLMPSLCGICHRNPPSNDPNDQADVVGYKINISGPSWVCHECAESFNEHFYHSVREFWRKIEDEEENL
jgi:hypothetical protein